MGVVWYNQLGCGAEEKVYSTNCESLISVCMRKFNLQQKELIIFFSNRPILASVAIEVEAVVRSEQLESTGNQKQQVASVRMLVSPLWRGPYLYLS